MTSRALAFRGSALAGAFLLIVVVGAMAQPPAEKPEAGSAPAKNGQRNPAAAFEGLVGAIKATPGCFGVEAAQTASGKQVIFAWFKDREALLDWYYSDAHQKLMGMMGDGHEWTDPLEGIAEGEGPLMCVAAVTWNKGAANGEKPKPDANYQPQMPISQISIEVFKPLTVAKAFNGSFSPAEALLTAPEPEPVGSK